MVPHPDKVKYTDTHEIPPIGLVVSHKHDLVVLFNQKAGSGSCAYGAQFPRHIAVSPYVRSIE